MFAMVYDDAKFIAGSNNQASYIHSKDFFLKNLK